MADSRAQLNQFLVEVFHDVMRLEEQELLKGPFKNLSVTEMHVIEAACDGQEKRKTRWPPSPRGCGCPPAA